MKLNKYQIISCALLLTTSLVGAMNYFHIDTSEEMVVTTPNYHKLEKLDRNMESMIRDEAIKATAQGLKPFVYFYADWCSHCRAVAKHMNDKRMLDAYLGTYIIAVNVDDWENDISESDFAIRGVPTFYPIDSEGTPKGQKITSAEWDDDIPENMAPILKKFFGIAEKIQ